MTIDLADWERRYGRMPASACVAMLSGYDPVKTFSGNDGVPAAERRKSLGFDAETMEALMSRCVHGIAVDAMSIDASEAMLAFPLHRSWLRCGRWALEGVANLDRVPVKDALLFAGIAPLENATGMSTRVIALW